MDRFELSKKRKAITREVDNGPTIVFGDDFERGLSDSSSTEGAETASGNENSEINSDDLSAEEQLSSDGTASYLAGQDDLFHVAGATNEQKAVDITVTGRHTQADFVEKEHERPNFKIERDANGADRFVYDEIDPDDNSEYDEAPEEENTIGNIPLSFYDSYPHVGYSINGKKIMRPAQGEALDALLDSMEVPKGWTGLTDPSTGEPMQLSQEELQLLRRIQMNEIPAEGYHAFTPTIEYFTSQLEIMPLSSAPEPKRRFVPSKHEAKRVMKIVRAIREGRILPYKPPEEGQEEDMSYYDIWANEKPRVEQAMHMPAPRLPPPGFDESYHPPPEYLPDTQEKKAWVEADEEDREKEYLPTDHGALRKVPGYDKFVKEKFERCLDLYLAPRVRRTKLNIDPESLLPRLPDPEELKPFPSYCSAIFHGHKGRVRSLSIDPSGYWLASGGDDGTVRVWNISTAREIWNVSLDADNAVNVVRWRPGTDTFILAIAAGDNIYFAIPGPAAIDPEIEAASLQILDAGWGHSTSATTTKRSSQQSPKWARPPTALADAGVRAIIPLGHGAKSVSFHRRGDYLVTVCPSPSVSSSTAVAIHTLSKHLTQYPFRKRLKGGGPPQTAHFHPNRPILLVANQRVIRAYDLSRQTLLKIIQPGARLISAFDIHPTSTAISGSDNLIVGSYDRRLLWHDLDLSVHPYKTLRYHTKAIRAVKFHPSGRYPLFADASDDGTAQVFHGKVVGDLMTNTAIVPLKVLRGHRVVGELGIMDLDWHPAEPWLATAGADGTCRLWI